MNTQPLARLEESIRGVSMRIMNLELELEDGGGQLQELVLPALATHFHSTQCHY